MLSNLRHLFSRSPKAIRQFNRMSSNSSQNSSEFEGMTNSRDSDIRALASMMEEGISPRVLLSHLAPSFQAPPGADEMMLWRLIVSMIDPPRRKKLTQFNTIDDAITLINRSKKILVLSGAGISTSAGLPDFRSRNGIYVQIHAEHPDLNDPKSMFDIHYFRKNPLPFYQFAKALFPGQYKPTVGHKFIKCLEDQEKLLRNYSQNIDTLEKQTGISRVIECHGSFARATCTNCKYEVDGDVIKDDIMQQKIPLCTRCHNGPEPPSDKLAVMKPNIVFFGEQLGEEFHSSLESDKDQTDLLIVIGSSLKVRPVALIPKSIPAHVPQILINKEPLEHMCFDIELLGDCDGIIQQLCLKLGGDWTSVCGSNPVQLTEIAGPPVPVVTIAATDEKNLDPDHQDIKIGDDNDKIDHDSVSTQSHQEDKSEDVSSIRTSIANVPSEGTDRNMTDDPDESINNAIQDDTEDGAISNCDKDSDADWEDVEVLDSSDSSCANLRAKANIEIPSYSYHFIKPNVYLFLGAELTNSQLASYTRES